MKSTIPGKMVNKKAEGVFCDNSTPTTMTSLLSSMIKQGKKHSSPERSEGN